MMMKCSVVLLHGFIEFCELDVTLMLQLELVINEIESLLVSLDPRGMYWLVPQWCNCA